MSSTSQNENAAAEMVGTLMLISIFVVVIAVIAVGWFSQSAPQKVPAISASITNESKIISIYQVGGDPIPWSELSILVDGVKYDYSHAPDYGDSWTIGEVITIDYPTFASKVDLVFYGSGTQQRLLISQYLGTMTPTQTSYAPTTSATPTPVPAPVASFTSNVTSGSIPLAVQFTDTSTNTPISWSWNFGDGVTSTDRNPVHTYTSAETYTVTLTVTNLGGSNTVTNYIVATKKSFVNFIIDDNVFVYGTKMNFAGDNVAGPYATIVITGPLSNADLNGGAGIAVNTIYVDGDVTLTSGSASLGSSSNPGTIYVNGYLNLWGGSRDIYGDVYVGKNLKLKNCNIHGNVYVNGDLTLDYGVPSIDTNKFIYYTGTLTAPNYYDTIFLSKCIKVATVPGFTMPGQTIPPTKSAAWYTAQGYVSSGALKSNMKIVADSAYTYSYSYSSGGSNPATNVIIIARNGDITLTGYGGGGVTGVFFAPYGKVTFDGGYLEGVVIARDGFFVTSGGTDVTFKNLDVYISNPNDYPF